jgi:CobW/HypB/UreG, nucleotide-binding domain
MMWHIETLGILLIPATCIVLIDQIVIRRGYWKRRKLLLNKVLWGFVTDVDYQENKILTTWEWRKVVLAGLMITTFCYSILQTKMNGWDGEFESDDVIVSFPVVVSLILLFVWILGSYGVWYLMLQRLNLSCKSTSSTYIRNSTINQDLQNSEWMQRIKSRESGTDKRLPITIVTGYLGSGKTTLIKSILNNTLGLKILIIENEIGSEGIDHELLIRLDKINEEIILFNNGCICCEIRNDLINLFHKLFSLQNKNKSSTFAKLDWIIIETTGVANPSPVIHTLYADEL